MGLIYNRFKPGLLAYLGVPSYVHGYSLGVEFIRNWFLSPFTSGRYNNFFKTVHISEKNMLDEFKIYDIGDYAKREAPAVTFFPRTDMAFDYDKVDAYYGSLSEYIRRSSTQNAFFRDVEKSLFIGVEFELMKLPVSIRVRVNSRAQQLDLYKFIGLALGMGATHTETLDIDYHIPYEIIINLAHNAGFEISTSSDGIPFIKDTEALLEYMNKNSAAPILYKKRLINGVYEFFVRGSDIYAHIDCLEDMQYDDGEQHGMIMSDFKIDINVTLSIPVPKFFIFYTKENCSFEIPVGIHDSNNVGLYLIKQMDDISEVNNKGWQRHLRTQYKNVTDDKINMKELFMEDNHLWTVIEDSLSIYMSPSAFIDIAVYINEFNMSNRINTYMNWKTMNLEINDEYAKNCLLYIYIYIDLKYINNRISVLNSLQKTRLS